jgi:AGAP012183-PA
MLRIAGLNGLRAVIRKTVSDDLQADIWDENHMDKIVPSLLYNMQDQDILADLKSPTSSSKSPSLLAEECLKELVGRASFGNIRSVIKPVLKHLDNHQLWDTYYPDEFAAHTFNIIMNSIQSQHSYAVIQIIMSHLDDKSKNKTESTENVTKEKTGIVTILSNIVAIAASESIGPLVLEIINSLLNHLRDSINNCSNDIECAEEEKKFQDTVINTLGEFCNNLPDFQKIEIMVFIISKVPPISSKSPPDILLQDILLKSLLKVSTKYKTVNMAQAFPNSFLKPLLSLSLAIDTNIRLTVQHIFHQLLDRHNNLPNLSKPISLAATPKINMQKAYRQDLMFMNKHGPELLMHIYENAYFSNNTIENFNALYTTMALLCVEMSCEDALSELFRLNFSIQELTISSTSIPETHKAALHGIVAGFFHLTADLTAIPTLCSHVHQVIKNRQEKCPSMLPEHNRYTAGRFSISEIDSKQPEEITDDLYFNKSLIAEALRSSGHDTTRLMTPFLRGNVGLYPFFVSVLSSICQPFLLSNLFLLILFVFK